MHDGAQSIAAFSTPADYSFPGMSYHQIYVITVFVHGDSKNTPLNIRSCHLEHEGIETLQRGQCSPC